MLTFLSSFFVIPTIVTQVLRIIASLFEAAVPVIKAALEAFIQFLKWMWVGLMDVLDDFRTIVFVVVVCGAAFLYGNVAPIVSYIPFVGKNQCEVHIAALKKQFDQCKMSLRQR